MAYNNKITVTSLTSPLATGVLKSTTGTGELTIAVNSDLPVMTSTVGGAVPTPPNNTTTFLRGDGTFAAPSAPAGSVVNNGNSFGANFLIGSNDNFPVQLESNGVVRFDISSGASTGGVTTITSVTANTSTVQDTLIVRTNSSGTAAAGFGGGILFQGESTTTDNRDMVSFQPYWVTATDATRAAGARIRINNTSQVMSDYFVFTNGNGNVGNLAIGAASAVQIQANSITTAQAFSIGNSSLALTLGNGSGRIITSTSASSASGAIELVPSSLTAGTDIGVKITGPAYVASSNDNKVLQLTASYTRSSGAFGNVSMIAINPTVNFTGTAVGGTTGIDISPTFTSLTAAGAKFYGLYMNYSNAQAYGVYQNGANTLNIINGKTAIGSTTDPTEALIVTGNTTTTGQQNAGDFQITDGAGFVVNWNNGNTQYVTIQANRTPTFSSPKNGATYRLRIIQGTGGSKLITWPTITWRGGTAPTLTTTAAKQDIIVLVYSNGVYYGDASLNY